MRMSFVDKVNITVAAGDGGDGRLSFRHEKFVDRGGPDGGDGGDGGDVIVMGSWNENTLATFRYLKEIHAQPGHAGDKRKKHGKRGGDLIVSLPVGTVVTDEQGSVIADLVEDGQRIVIAEGGKGGFGNAHFISSTRQAPRIAEKGEKGQRVQTVFELKMLADVGLVGLPNAGKSTLLSVISNARPEIANYPFTTLTPNLGVVDIDQKTSILMADIPGLIAGAAEGKGLGDEFLRHVERTLVLIHLIDAYQDDVAKAYQTIQSELKAYKLDLTKRPQIVVLTKTEGLDSEMIADLEKQLRAVVPKTAPIIAIAAQAKQGTTELLRRVEKLLEKEKAEQAKTAPAKDTLPIIRLPESDDNWHIEKTKTGFIVTGKKIERFAGRTDFSSEAGTQRLRDIMRKMGIMQELARLGALPEQKVVIGYHSLEY
jgi:GTP-binding protein